MCRRELALARAAALGHGLGLLLQTFHWPMEQLLRSAGLRTASSSADQSASEIRVPQETDFVVLRLMMFPFSRGKWRASSTWQARRMRGEAAPKQMCAREPVEIAGDPVKHCNSCSGRAGDIHSSQRSPWRLPKRKLPRGPVECRIL